MPTVGHCSSGLHSCSMCNAGMVSLLLLLFAGSLASDLTICIVEEENFLQKSYNVTADRGRSKVTYEKEKVDDLLKSSLADLAVRVSLVRHVVSRSQFAWLSLTACDTLNSSCAGVVTLASCEHAEHIRSWARKHVIPYVMIPSERTCAMTSSQLKDSVTSQRTDHKVLQEILLYLEWTQVAIIVDSRGVVGLLNQLSDVYMGSILFRLFDYIIDNGSGTAIVQKDLGQHVHSLLDTIRLSHFYNILVVASKDNASLILREAEKMNLLTRDRYWVISLPSSLSSGLVDDVIVADNNILVVKPLPVCANATHSACSSMQTTCKRSPPIEETTIAAGVETLVRAVMKTRCPEQAITTTTTTSTTAASNEHSSVCENSTDALSRRTAITKALDELQKRKTDRINASPTYSICRTQTNRTQKLVPVGNWSQQSGLLMDSGPVFRDFGHTKLKIGTQEAKPFVQKVTVNGSITRFEGLCIDILNELAQALKFTYEIYEPEDGEWGAPKDDQLKNWTGIVQQVLNKEVDIGIGPFTITSIREEVIDFTKPFMEDGVGILTKKPNSDAKNMFKMFTPLTPAVWGAVAGAVVVVSVFLYLIERSSPFSARSLEGDKKLGMIGCIWLIYGSYMEQGGEPHPRSVSARCLVGCWWLFTILMSSTYTANLAAFLTVTVEESPVNSLAELAASSTLKPLAKQGSNVKTLFEIADGGMYKDIWRKMSDMPPVKSNQQALRHVLTGNYAYMTDASQLEYIMLRDCTVYSLAKERFNTGGFGFVLREKSPYMDLINHNIMKMQEAGLMDKWRQRWWSSPDPCLPSGRTSGAKELDWTSLSGLFYIFLGIASGSVLLRLLEFWLHGDKLIQFWNRLKCMARQATSGDNAAVSSAPATQCMCSAGSEVSIKTQCTSCSTSVESIARSSTRRQLRNSSGCESGFDCLDARAREEMCEAEMAEVNWFQDEDRGGTESLSTIYDSSIISSGRRQPFQDFDGGSTHYLKPGIQRRESARLNAKEDSWI